MKKPLLDKDQRQELRSYREYGLESYLDRHIELKKATRQLCKAIEQDITSIGVAVKPKADLVINALKSFKS